jgi:hypothetical protein
MKKLLISGLLIAAVLVTGFAQKPHMVVFYNLENLFDTINDPDKWDEEFLPDGAKKWNSVKYQKKLSNMERVLFDIAAINKNFPVVIGVSEIENRLVLEDLIAQPKLAHGNYRIVHYDSPDRRGVDCAFFYRPDIFKLEGSKAHKFDMPGMPNFYTRDLVTMWGTIEGEPFFFLVSHWPSRLGGKEASDPKREAAARQCRRIADSVRMANPNTKLLLWATLTTTLPTRASPRYSAQRATSRNSWRATSTTHISTFLRLVMVHLVTVTLGTCLTILSYQRTSQKALQAHLSSFVQRRASSMAISSLDHI